jgi:hypothetical protein
MSARLYPDVSILLTLDFEQEPLLRKCTIFKESIQHSNITCYQLSTVKAIRDSIAQEVVEAGGNALRGLWHHLSMAKGAGVPRILENAILTEADLPSIQSFFKGKMQAQKRDLAKTQIQIQEVWAIDTLRTMERTHSGGVPIINYLKRLVTRLNDYYVEAKNNLLRTEKDLNLKDEEQINPKPQIVDDLEKALIQVGFADREDISHIACLTMLKKEKDYIPVFATVDRKLYECKDVIYEKTGVIVEDALYAGTTYRSSPSKK